MSEKDDLELETKIDNAFLKMSTAATPFQRKKHFAEMKKLINSRSAEQVAKMEKEQGLK